MGPKLRNLVESQLLEDLKNYRVEKRYLKFDWSQSCIEGHALEYLDGSVENFSSITVFDEQDRVTAEGWMEFVHGGEFFLAFWDLVKTWDGNKKLGEKKQFGIPSHVWQKIPDGTKPTWKKERMER